jgi:hypothetical protein
MRSFFVLFTIGLIAYSCTEKKEISSINPVNWEKRKAQLPGEDSLFTGKTYLSVYSQIYSLTEHRTHDLTATISMRNTSDADTIYILKADYFDTHGQLIRHYFDHPIYLTPMETVEIVIDEVDREGGTGANFIFQWQTKPTTAEPLFEGVMISTSGQQGLSFTTTGKRIE